MLKSTPTPFLLLILSLLLAACSGSSEAPVPAVPDGVAENLTGASALFAEKGCIACHAIEASSDARIGPSMVELVARSEKIIQAADYTGNAETVEEYIRESILNPDIYIVDDYGPVMPKTYPASLTEPEITDLVDYLLTLE